MRPGFRRDYQILIVDDDPVDIFLLRKLLSEQEQLDHNYLIYDARDGAEAEEHCRNHRIDALLLDYNLPGDDGISILRRLQESFPGKRLPAILFTGDASQKLLQDAARVGVSGFLKKDYKTSPERIDRAITRVVNWVARA